MSSRLARAVLPMHTFTRSTALAINPPVRDRINHKVTGFPGLDDSTMEPSTQVKTSNPPWSGPKMVEGDGMLDKLNKTCITGGQDGKILRMWQPVEKAPWLERFGGPGNVTCNDEVVLREAGSDGKVYLKVLI
ncbi:hypothetical protein OPT61_g5 [Boeremia exigua]|uniref:Uncharacterized protein n=1 Tax=Boeremia exigua TaxID=749465 RepID=A0ACC2IV66_9PLEO|nr:hypothetical protein OPT61_g5 [Boeremia exigua]